MYSVRTGSQFENAAKTIAVFSSKAIGGVKSGMKKDGSGKSESKR